MAKVTHSNQRRGRDVSASKAEKEVYVVEDFSGAKDEQKDESLDSEIAEFEAKPEEAKLDEENTMVEESVDKTETNIEFPLPSRKTEENLNKSLENLIFMGKHSKIIDIAKHKFEISTLTHRENNVIVKELMTFGDAADLFTIRILTLAFALRSIDDKELNDIEVAGDYKTDLHRRMTIIDHLQLGIVVRLHNAYEKLVEEADKIVYNENIKN